MHGTSRFLATFFFASVCFLTSSPCEARFLQADPVGYKADVDLYTYVANDPTDKTDPSGKTTLTVGYGGELTVGSKGASFEEGFVVAFPTPWDPDTKLDLGTYMSTSTDRQGGLGGYGGSIGGSLKGGISDMNGTEKTTTTALIASVTTSSDGSASTDIPGTGRGVVIPTSLKGSHVSAKAKLKTKEGGVAVGYSTGTTTTRTMSLNHLMLRLETEARKYWNQQADPLNSEATKKGP